MDYEYEDPAVEGDDGMEVEESDNNKNAMEEEVEEEEDIPVTQEDAWAVIRCVLDKLVEYEAVCSMWNQLLLRGIWDTVTLSSSCANSI